MGTEAQSNGFGAGCEAGALNTFSSCDGEVKSRAAATGEVGSVEGQSDSGRWGVQSTGWVVLVPDRERDKAGVDAGECGVLLASAQ